MNLRPAPSLPLRAAACALALALTACVTLPPDRHAVAERAIAPTLAEVALPPGAWPSTAWWRDYHDSTLDALVTQALASYPSLASARARIEQASAAVSTQRAQSGAQLGLDVSLARQRYSANGLFPEPIGGNTYNDVAVQLKGSYDFDWWGRHRAQTAAALGEANARQAELAQAQQVLAAAVAHSYFDLHFVQARQSSVAQQRASASAIGAERTRRVRAGLARSDEVRAAELDLAKLEQLDAQLDSAAGQLRAALRALVGADAALPAVPAASLMSTPPHTLPARMGMELLARRPDLQAAHWRVEAALGRTDAARAAFYPDFNLNGALGLDAVSLARLLRAGSLTTLIGSAVQLPLFDNGRLDAALSGVRAQRDEAISEYNQAVVNAVRDVAQQAAVLHGFDQELARQGVARASAASQLDAMRQRARAGMADQASVLQATLALQAQDDAALQLRQAQRSAEISLTQALGGGYASAARPVTVNLSQNQQP